MEKIVITEEQYNKLISLNKEESKQDLLENIEVTKGNLEVRNLIIEGEIIKGEVKSAFGVWNLTEWDNSGNPIGIENTYNQKINQLPVEEIFGWSQGEKDQKIKSEVVQKAVAELNAVNLDFIALPLSVDAKWEREAIVMGLRSRVNIFKEKCPTVVQLLPETGEFNGGYMQSAMIVHGTNCKAYTPTNLSATYDNGMFSGEFLKKTLLMKLNHITPFEGAPTSLSEITNTNDNVYFDTFSGAVQYARQEAENKGYTVDENDWSRDISFGGGKPSVGQTTMASIGLSLNGKVQRKNLQIQVYGMDSGSYELNHYIS